MITITTTMAMITITATRMTIMAIIMITATTMGMTHSTSMTSIAAIRTGQRRPSSPVPAAGGAA